MSRKLQHISEESSIIYASRKGRKVEVLCGKRVYPLPDMSDDIPTCTRCSRVQTRMYNDLVLRPR